MKRKLSIYILGVRVDRLSKEDFLNEVIEILKKGRKEEISQYIVTPYSEFFIAARKDDYFKRILNESALSIADGIFVLWAGVFTERMKKIKSKGFLRFLKATAEFVYTGSSILLNRKLMTSIFPERISGSNISYDLCRICEENGFRLAILGGFDFGSGNTGILAKNKLLQLYPKLKIVEVYPGDRKKEEFGDPVIKILKDSKADLLFCCYSPVRQEKWLYENLAKTGITLGIGLGGTLDYISGVKKLPPESIRKLGLEWLVRPFYAEGGNMKRLLKRISRAWPATIISSFMVFRDVLKG